MRTILLSGTLLLTGSMAPAFAQLAAGGVELPPDYNTFQPRIQVTDEVSGEVVRHWTRRGHFLNFQGYCIGLKDPDPDGHNRIGSHVFKHNDGHAGRRIHHQPSDPYLDASLIPGRTV